MTVSSTLGRDISVGNSSTTVFTVPFRILDKTHLRVVKYTIATGATADLVQDTDYTVQNVGSANAQYTTIGASSPYSSGYKLIAIRAVPLSQADDYVENSAFPAETVEAELDKLTMIAQQHQDLLNRAAIIPEFAATSLRVVLPVPADQYMFYWDGATGTISNTSFTISSFATDVSDTATNAALALSAAASASASASSASSSASSATSSASSATSSASTASTAATNASNSAVSASSSASSASTSAGAASSSETNAATSASSASTSATLASQWASLTSGIVAATDYSAKAWAIGGTSISDGAAKNWAQQTGADVTGATALSRSAKSWAQEDLHGATYGGSAKDWASSASLPDGILKSAKSYASDSSTSATASASSASAASVSASNASTSETNAGSSATAAAASAAAAAASAAGISMKSSCRAASTGALTVTYANGTLGVGATLTNAGAQAAISIDGVSLAVNERVLIKDQGSAFQNGIYFVTVVGTGATNWILTRSTDYDQAAEIVEGTATIIEEGTTNSSHIYVMTHNGAITVGTTAIDYTSLTANATSANTLTTPRAVYGNNFDGSTALTQVIASTYGGTGNGFTKFSGPTTAERTKTLRDASDTILELGGSYTPTGSWTSMTLVTPALGTPASGTLTNCTGYTDANISTSDVTTNDASTAKHGFLKKLDNTQTNYMDGKGAWSNPALNAVLTGYTSGAGTVAATDTILQAIQKLNGNIASLAAAGLTVLASGNLATGSPSSVDISSISGSYNDLVLYIEGASDDTASRQLTVNIACGGDTVSTTWAITSFTQVAGTTTTAVPSNITGLWTPATETAAQVSSCLINFPSYVSGPIKQYWGRANIVSTAGSNWTTGTQIATEGVLVTVAATTPETRAITGIHMAVNSNVFDAGTYTLYGRL